MPRRQRSFHEGIPLHVYQRGNNRTDMFHDVRDRTVFLLALLESSRRYGVAVHNWVLMNNHFHLMVTPAEEDSLPRTMQQVGRRYVPYFNKRNERTGGLWEGRYNAHLVNTEAYWLRCTRYIELNPVRAGIVKSPQEYPWSSYRALACGATDKLITPHPLYLASGGTPADRQAAHRSLCGTPLEDGELAAIRYALRSGVILDELSRSTVALAG